MNGWLGGWVDGWIDHWGEKCDLKDSSGHTVFRKARKKDFLLSPQSL